MINPMLKRTVAKQGHRVCIGSGQAWLWCSKSPRPANRHRTGVLAKTGILAADVDGADARVSRCGVATKHRFNVIFGHGRAGQRLAVGRTDPVDENADVPACDG
jgi:hypothetical protein